MQVRKVNFREAVEALSTFVGSPAYLSLAAKPQIKQIQVAPASEIPAENAPFKGSYDKYKVESPWLRERGLEPATCDRFEVFQYDNPVRRSQYTGSVMLKIRRYRDGESLG